MPRLVAFALALLGLAACSTPSARLPGMAYGLGSATPDCVATCRALFATCPRISVFVDHEQGSLEAGRCASDCTDEAELDAALAARGCTSQWAAYESCVLSHVDADCQVMACSIEWGVYDGCMR